MSERPFKFQREPEVAEELRRIYRKAGDDVDGLPDEEVFDRTERLLAALERLGSSVLRAYGKRAVEMAEKITEKAARDA